MRQGQRGNRECRILFSFCLVWLVGWLAGKFGYLFKFGAKRGFGAIILKVNVDALVVQVCMANGGNLQ
jgi:hypothetical protein